MGMTLDLADKIASIAALIGALVSAWTLIATRRSGRRTKNDEADEATDDES